MKRRARIWAAELGPRLPDWEGHEIQPEEAQRERERDRKMGDGAVAGSSAYPIRCVAIGWDASCWGVPNLLQTLFSLSGTNPNGCRLDAMQ